MRNFRQRGLHSGNERSRRRLKKIVQQDHRERRAEAYSLRYVEAVRDARTPLGDVFSLLHVS
ncbi:MAG: hypothetical protein DYH03_07955 [Nitrospira sp. NTP1]|nr:hypothetical protein [Nitrospira sp. NTP1]